MNKLDTSSYDVNRWNIKRNSTTEYEFTNIITGNSYTLDTEGGIDSIYQTSDNTFIIIRRLIFFKKDFCIYKFEDNNNITIQCCFNFSSLAFLTEDIILFDEKTSATMYSISKNLEIHTLNHLFNSNTNDDSYVESRNINLIYDCEDSEYPAYIAIDYRLKSTETKEYIQIILDSTSIQILKVYSTLRNQYVTLSDSFTLGDLVKEENHYLSIIDSFLRYTYKSSHTKSHAELVSTIE